MEMSLRPLAAQTFSSLRSARNVDPGPRLITAKERYMSNKLATHANHGKLNATANRPVTIAEGDLWTAIIRKLAETTTMVK